MFIKYTLFKKRPKVGDYQLLPLSAGRVLILEELGNPLGTGEASVEVDPMSIYEAFLVATMSGDDLAEAVSDTDDWAHKVKVFSLGMDDDVLNKFWEILQEELKAAAEKMTEAASPKAHLAGKKAVKKRPSRRKK